MFIGLYCCLLLGCNLYLLLRQTYTTPITFGLYFKGPSSSFSLATPYSIWEQKKISPQQMFIPKDTFVTKGIFVPTDISIQKSIFGLIGILISKGILIPKGIFVLTGIFGPTGVLIPKGIFGLTSVLIPKGIFVPTGILILKGIFVQTNTPISFWCKQRIKPKPDLTNFI